MQVYVYSYIIWPFICFLWSFSIAKIFSARFALLFQYYIYKRNYKESQKPRRVVSNTTVTLSPISEKAHGRRVFFLQNRPTSQGTVISLGEHRPISDDFRNRTSRSELPARIFGTNVGRMSCGYLTTFVGHPPEDRAVLRTLRGLKAKRVQVHFGKLFRRAKKLPYSFDIFLMIIKSSLAKLNKCIILTIY